MSINNAPNGTNVNSNPNQLPSRPTTTTTTSRTSSSTSSSSTSSLSPPRVIKRKSNCTEEQLLHVNHKKKKSILNDKTVNESTVCPIHPAYNEQYGYKSFRCACKLTEVEKKKYNDLLQQLNSIKLLNDPKRLQLIFQMMEICDQDFNLHRQATQFFQKIDQSEFIKLKSV